MSKTKESRAFEKLDEHQKHAWLSSLYDSAMRTGSIRAVEDRHRIGRNRLYRWAQKNKLPVPRPQMGPKKKGLDHG